MQPQLPSELIRVIIRDATYIPNIFDTTSLQNFSASHLAESAERVMESMSTKRSLCLVSKAFRELTEEFLYETIVIYKLRQIRPLVLSLRSLLSWTQHRAFRGERVKRLDFLLGHKPEGFRDTPWETIWPWGSRSLWGLLPACPRLELLVLHPSPSSQPLDVPTSLWMHLASVASNLRALVIRISMPEPILSKVLPACKSLEVLLIDNIIPSHAMVQANIDRLPPIKVGRALSYEEVSEYMVDSDSAQWPRYSQSRVLLRQLHSLAISCSNKKLLDDIDLPSLKALRIEGPWSFRFFSKFTSTITHLILEASALWDHKTIWSMLDLFPKVHDLTVNDGEVDIDTLSSTYSQLESLKISRISPSGIRFLLDTMKEGNLTGLKEIVLLDIYDSTIDQDEFLQGGKRELANRGVVLKGATL